MNFELHKELLNVAESAIKRCEYLYKSDQLKDSYIMALIEIESAIYKAQCELWRRKTA